MGCADKRDGFTLLEILVVVAILGMLVAFVAPQVFGGAEKAKYKMASAQVAALEQAIERFSLDNGRYPTASEGLAALVPPPPADLPNYDPKGYEKFVPSDPWDNPYVYLTDGRAFRVVSYGRDGRPGGEGYNADIDSALLGRSRG